MYCLAVGLEMLEPLILMSRWACDRWPGDNMFLIYSWLELRAKKVHWNSLPNSDPSVTNKM